MLPEWFVVVAAFIGAAGAWSYGRDTLAGRTQPNRVTWGLWGLAPMIAFAAQLSEGVGLPALMTFMTGFCPLMIVAVSFANPAAYWRARRRDLLCLGISLAALVGWGLTRHGAVAIALALVADFSAGVPTIAKAWRHPGTETPVAFAATATSALITLACLSVWRFETFAFPLLILCVSGTIFVLVRFPTLGPGRPAPVATVEPVA
jgi:hypothetical protein